MQILTGLCSLPGRVGDTAAVKRNNTQLLPSRGSLKGWQEITTTPPSVFTEKWFYSQRSQSTYILQEAKSSNDFSPTPLCTGQDSTGGARQRSNSVSFFRNITKFPCKDQFASGYRCCLPVTPPLQSCTCAPPGLSGGPSLSFSFLKCK